MKQAYIQTINDFEIELRNTEWWRFKRIKYLNKQIQKYEGLIQKLKS